MKPDKILVLSDPFVEVGCLHFSLALSPFAKEGIEIRRITSGFITSGELLEHPNSVLVLPGSGDGDGYRQSMNGTGFQNERLFLEAGGRSLRICAAAYMAYESYGFHDKRYDNSLSFLFRGHAHGPISELYHPERPWRTLLDTHDIAMLDHYRADGSVVMAASAYSAGPRLPETENAHIIARFRDARDTTPAVLASQVGEGLSVVSSVALEINGAFVAKNLRPQTPHHIAMQGYAESLAEYEPERSGLWHDVWENYLLADTPVLQTAS